MKIRNTFIIFLVSGFWHGANWTFIVWGFLNALYIMPSIIFNTNRVNLEIVAKGKIFPSVKDFFAIGLTFSLTVIAWIFFRATNVTHAFTFITDIFTSSLFTKPNFVGMEKASSIILLTCVFMLIEWIGREQKYAIEFLGKGLYRPYRWAFYYCLLLTIYFFSGSEQQFIYFQF
jgi:D-alanyl-lipoteichoic acid acyltransferase DltB (MBOAT superfamily)